MNDAWHVTLITLLAAPFIGSFIGVVVHRLPDHRPIIAGRSVCDHCARTLGFRDLVPVLSWAASRARCRHCGAAISVFYPLTELGALVIAAWAVALVSGEILIATAVFGWMLLTLALIDARTQLLPDSLTLPLVAAGLGFAFMLDRDALVAHFVGAAAGFAVFAVIGYTYQAISGRAGLGLGDAKLLAALGAWVSWTGLPTVVLYAGAAGLIYVLMRAWAGQPLTAHDRVPFGPFLALGGWLVWLYGPVTFT